MKKLTPAFLLILLFCGFILAQGEDPGVKKSTPKPPPKMPVKVAPKQKSSSPTAVKKTAVKNPVDKNAAAKTVYGNLSIFVNEPNSEVFLSDENGNVLEEDSYFTAKDGSPLELEDVTAGNYKMMVRKYGFFEEARSITVIAGRVNTINITLRPSGVLLTIHTDPSGANIEIVGAGEYETNAENLILQPGKYVINVYKNGYQSEARKISFTSSGQKQELNISLNPFPLQERLAEAERYLADRDLIAASNSARKILSAAPQNARASLIAGLSGMANFDSQNAVFFLSRAIGFGETATLPVRIFNKDSGGMQIISGNLSISQGTLQFNSANRPELNFTLPSGSISESFEKLDDFGLTSIIVKARGDFGGKTDRRTITFYANSAAVRPSRKELFCSSAGQNSLPCALEERVMYDLIDRWKNKDFFSRQAGFGAILPPSEEFMAVETAAFSLRVPNNWQILDKSDSGLLAAPTGGFDAVDGNHNYSHGISMLLENSPEQDPSGAHGVKVNAIRNSNSYLQPISTANIKLRAGNALMTTLTGVSPVSMRKESVVVYTLLTRDMKIFSMITVIPPDETAAYESTFRRILNSISFK